MFPIHDPALERDVSVGQVVLAVLVMLVTPGTRGSQF